MTASDNKYDSFIFRETWWLNMKNLPAAFRAEVYDAVCLYVFEGKEPEFDPMSATSMAARFILTDIEHDKSRYDDVREKRAAAGRKHKGNQYASEQLKQAVAVGTNGTNGTSGTNGTDNEDVYEDVDVNGLNNNDNNSSFSFPADAEKKEKIIFEFSLILLSEGRANAYAEATEAYNYNDATGWETEKTDKAGNVTKKKIRNKLAWIQAGWNRHNEQIYAPAHGMILANILRRTGCRPENADIINGFRGFMFDGDESNIAFCYVRRNCWQKFAKAISDNQSVNVAVFDELQKEFPKVRNLHFKTY